MNRYFPNFLDNTPPGLNPKKAAYMASDLEKNAKYWGLPIKMPEVSDRT